MVTWAMLALVGALNVLILLLWLCLRRWRRVDLRAPEMRRADRDGEETSEQFLFVADTATTTAYVAALARAAKRRSTVANGKTGRPVATAEHLGRRKW